MNIQLYDDVFLHYDKPNYWEKNTASKPQQKRVEIDGCQWLINKRLYFFMII